MFRDGLGTFRDWIIICEKSQVTGVSENTINDVFSLVDPGKRMDLPACSDLLDHQRALEINNT